MHQVWPAVRLALVVVLVNVALVALVLVSQDGRTEWFLRLGTDDPHMIDKAREELGTDDVAVPYQIPHDGTTFWLHAHDPLLIDSADVRAYLDEPAYRVRRVMYPLLASPGTLAGERGLLASLVIVNLVAIGLGTYWAARLAQELGASVLFGLGFALNPAAVVGLFLDLSDTVALAGLVGGVLAARRHRLGWAIVACAVAVLAKESSLLCVLALAIGAPLPRRSRWLLAIGPTAALLAWSVYSAWRVSFEGLTKEAFEIVPLAGYVAGVTDEWPRNGNWSDAVVAFALVALMIATIVRWWNGRTLEMWLAASNAVLWPFVSVLVLRVAPDSTRIFGPALLFLVLDIGRERAASGRMQLLRPDYRGAPQQAPEDGAEAPRTLGEAIAGT